MVGDSELTEYQLDSLMGATKYSGKMRKELIKEWVENEMLYREAVKNEVDKDDEFNFILESSRRHLAGSIQLRNVLKSELNNISDSELRAYYEDFKNDFILPADAFAYNIASFGSKSDAINFRKLALENWNEAIGLYNQKLINESFIEFEYIFNIRPVNLLRVLNKMYINEVSVILNLTDSVFTIAQLKERFEKGELPKFESVKEEVRNRYRIKLKQQLYKDYIDGLYAKYDVVISEVN